MRGSQAKVRRQKRGMACCFTCSRCMATFIIISSLFGLSVAEKEILFERRWENNQSNDDGGETNTGWTSNGILCGPQSNDKLPLKYVNTKDANRVFVEVEYEITHNFMGSGGLYILSNLVTSENNSETRSEDVPIKRLVGDNKKGRTTVTLEYGVNEDDNFLNLTVYGVKICVRVYKIRVYFYVCPANKSLSVNRTVAPSSGFTEVSANCPIQQSGQKGTVLVAKCGSNGEWTKLEDKVGCTDDCDAGTELINGTCTVCKENFYKATRGTHPCAECPKNTLSEQSRKRCKCQAEYYRNTESGPCQTVPPVPKDFNYTRLSFNTIRLSWDMLHYDGGGNSGLKFHVKCKQYYGIDGRAWGHCRNISLGVRGVNVTVPPVEVKYLSNNTNYTFTVYALNEVSSHVSYADWKRAYIYVHLPGRRTTHTRPSGFTTVETSPTEGTFEPATTPSATTTTPLVSRESSSGSKTEITASPHIATGSTQFFPYIGVAIGAIIVILILIAIVIYRRKRVKKNILNQDVLLDSFQPAYVDPIKYGNPEKAVRRFAKEIDRREIRLEGLIGEGEFAKVHKGMLCRSNEPPVPVALKVLKPGSTPKNREDFLTEAAVMGQFKDMNIVALEGVVTQSHPVMIITEFMHNGALSTYLAQRKNHFSEIQLLGMARGIASGMKYLAKMRFVHRDLAARNVLVNENMVCKVADFGLTRELEESCQGEYVTQGGKIPIRWTAPEAYKHRRFTTASDVWSYGIVLWEIMSYAQRPYGDWDNYMVMDQVFADYRLTAPTNCPKIVHQLMTECWNSDRTQRPSFSDIVEMLERWIRNPYLLKDYQYVTEKDRMADRKSCVAKSIREYLEVIKMDRYIDNFIDFGYTELYQIQNMTDDDLVGIGVPLVGHRNKIIKSLRGERELLLPEDV